MDKDTLGLALLIGGAIALIIVAPPVAFIMGLALLYSDELRGYLKELKDEHRNSDSNGD